MPLIQARLTDQKTRGYLYRCLVAAAPLLVSYGVMSGAEVALWLAAGASWLGVSVAAYNTPTKPQ